MWIRQNTLNSTVKAVHLCKSVIVLYTYVKSTPIIYFFLLQETRRRQQAEAAEKRQREIEGRGVKDPEALRRKQQKREEMEKKAELSPGSGEPNLKVNLSYLLSQGSQLLR